eukprot:6337932-Prymnesium_polylepis.1
MHTTTHTHTHNIHSTHTPHTRLVPRAAGVQAPHDLAGPCLATVRAVRRRCSTWPRLPVAREGSVAK